MDQQFDFRALLLKLQDCLSDNDRRRLHFIVGDTIPRQLRDDPSLGGTLNLLETLFDQAKISEQDFNYLIQIFREIHCYEGVRRLQEYQLTKNGGRTIRTESNVSDVLCDNDTDRVVLNRTSIFTILKDNNDPAENSTSNPGDKENNNHTGNAPISITSIKSHKKVVNINATIIKQTLKSRLTICQLVLLLLNIISILIFIAVVITLRNRSCTGDTIHHKEVLIIQPGPLYGEILGGDGFDDAANNSLTLRENLIAVKASWWYDTLTTVTFIYSNNASSQHGTGDAIRVPLFSGEIKLNATERFIGVTLYKGLRDIVNPFKPNGTLIIVGIQFMTSTNRMSDVFGSENGTKYSEAFPNYQLAYVKGRSYGFIDGLQFIWSKPQSYSRTAPISKMLF